jgi:hypothetical protein
MAKPVKNSPETFSVPVIAPTTRSPFRDNNLDGPLEQLQHGEMGKQYALPQYGGPNPIVTSYKPVSKSSAAVVGGGAAASSSDVGCQDIQARELDVGKPTSAGFQQGYSDGQRDFANGNSFDNSATNNGARHTAGYSDGYRQGYNVGWNDAMRGIHSSPC